MPIRYGRKISELSELTSASLQTYIVGVDNNTTYKISLDVLEDAVIGIVSTSTDSRLDSLEAYTASFTSSTNGISSLNSYTASTNIRLDNLEQSTSSFFTEDNLNPQENNFVAVFSEENKIQKGVIFVTGSRVIIGGPSSSQHPLTPEAFAVYSQLDSYNLISGHGTTNTYLQLNIKNFSNLSNASSDIVATADNGTEDSYYVNMGINGSGYDEDTVIGLANDAYVYGYGNEFHIGNAAEYPVKIFAGGFDARGEHLKFIIDPFDNHTMTGSFEISGNFTCLGNITGDIEFSNLLNVPTIISSSQQITDFGFVSSSTSIPAGTISGSSQLTSSFDLRYILSGSVSMIPVGTISGSAQITAFGFVSSSTGTPSGTISGSSQLTSSFDGRYIQTGSFNTLTSSFNSFTASAQSVTTGSNVFNGTQIITGSLIVTSGSFIGSQLTANTSSLYLTSGSNLYVQNNALVEITGSLIATSITGSIAATNGIISGSSQLISAFPTKTIGSWSVPAGASTQSFTVEANNSYDMWVNGNIPNGIIMWNAKVSLANTNVAAVGNQYGWYYSAGNTLVLTSIPSQIVGTAGSIITTDVGTTTSNVFSFGITNNSGTTQTIYYGYIKLS